MKRTVLGAASVEAKRFGVRTGMQIWEAKKLCPGIILVPGDSDKYLEVTKRFLSILKDYSPYLEVFSIDECFLEMPAIHLRGETELNLEHTSEVSARIAQVIKQRISIEIGEWIKCSIGISYNKLLAKLAGSLQKPDGLVIIPDQETAIKVLDTVELDAICGIGGRIKKRLFNMGVTDFKKLRAVPLQSLLASFKSYGQVLYNMARGIDNSPVLPFYEKEEVKSIGHRHTIDHDTDDLNEIKAILLKLTELIARKLRAKKLVGKTISCWFRYGFHLPGEVQDVPSDPHLGGVFLGDGMQTTIQPTNDGLDIFKAAWKIFQSMWSEEKIRMIGVSISNLKTSTPQNLSLLPETSKRETILRAIDKINDKYGEFTLTRGILLGTSKIRRRPNPFLADRRFMVQ